MNELIKINIDTNGIETVNARDLHEFLDSKREFATWIKQRISSFDFIEGKDFTIDRFVIGRATIIDYHLTINIAKELAMVENNAKGKEARLYFLEREKKAKELEVKQHFAIPKTYREALLLAAAQEEKIEQQLLVIQEQTPKVEALERFTKLEGSVTITNAAKNINVSPSDLFDWMSRKEWIYKRKDMFGNKIGNWIAYQDKIKSGYLELKPVKIIKELGNSRIEEQTLVTPKGLAKLAQLVNFSTDNY